MNKDQQNHNNKNLNLLKDRNKLLHSSSKKTNTIINKNIENEDVYDILRKIPAGKVSTYGDIAKALGHPSSARIIGRILGENPNPIQVPCHRVVMSNGKLGGYKHGIERKKELLEKEGLSLINGITVGDFDNIRFYPHNSKTNLETNQTNFSIVKYERFWTSTSETVKEK